MEIIIYRVLLILMFISLVTVIIAFAKQVGDNVALKISVKSYEKDVQLMAVEQKNIMSLNKMCIEKWERAVLDNVNLNQSNLRLINLLGTEVQDH